MLIEHIQEMNTRVCSSSSLFLLFQFSKKSCPHNQPHTKCLSCGEWAAVPLNPSHALNVGSYWYKKMKKKMKRVAFVNIFFDHFSIRTNLLQSDSRAGCTQSFAKSARARLLHSIPPSFLFRFLINFECSFLWCVDRLALLFRSPLPFFQRPLFSSFEASLFIQHELHSFFNCLFFFSFISTDLFVSLSLSIFVHPPPTHVICSPPLIISINFFFCSSYLVHMFRLLWTCPC